MQTYSSHNILTLEGIRSHRNHGKVAILSKNKEGKEGRKMQKHIGQNQTKKLSCFCMKAKNLIVDGEYEKCHHLVCEVMREFPDAPQPHNILGILLEKTGHHPEAMNHFRAALALDATYRPAEENLESYGTFYCHGKCVYGNENHTCIVRRKENESF